MMTISNLRRRRHNRTVRHAEATLHEFNRCQASNRFAGQHFAVVTELPLRIDARIGNSLTHHPHHLFGDGLGFAKVFDLLVRFDASIEDSQVFIVLQFNFSLLQMPSKDKWQRTIGFDPFNTFGTQHLNQCLRRRGFAVRT